MGTFIMVFTTVPYLIGYGQQRGEQVFGGAILDRPDYNVYVAGIQAGLQGISYYPMLHTPEQGTPVYLRLFYVWVGLLGQRGPFSAATLYQIARWICSAMALGVMYVFAASVFRSVLLRRFAWLTFAFGAGFGWLMVLFNWFPPSGVAPADFSQLDLFGFLTLLLTPHFTLTEALLWATALAFMQGWNNSAHSWLWISGGIIMAILTQSVQVYAPLPLDIALGLYALWHWLRERRVIWHEALSLLALSMAQLPWTMYSLWVFQTNPIWHSYFVQNQLLSLPVLDYILGLGAVGLLAVAGLYHVSRRHALGPFHLMALWVVVVVAAIYWPSQLQRRFVAGVIGPIAILATLGMVRGAWPTTRKWLRDWRVNRHWLRGLVFGITLLVLAQSSLWLLAGISLSIYNRHPTYFDSVDEWNAMHWLGDHTNRSDPIFSSLAIGNTIPAAIGHRVYVGHWAESVDYEARVEAVLRYYRADTPEAERVAIISACQCRYLFYGLRERELGPFEPEQAGYLVEVYRNPSVVIYEIDLSQIPSRH